MTSPVYPSTHSLNPTHDYLVALAHETATCLSSNARKVLSRINNGQETVDLSDIVISGNDLQHIANNISELKNIKNLDLSHTKLDAVGVRAVIKICTEPSMLKCINLHNCGLDETLLKVLAEKGKIISPYDACREVMFDEVNQNAEPSSAIHCKTLRRTTGWTE